MYMNSGIQEFIIYNSVTAVFQYCHLSFCLYRAWISPMFPQLASGSDSQTTAADTGFKQDLLVRWHS